MHQEQRQRTVDLLNSKGIQRALFTNPASTAWLTGVVPEAHMFLQGFSGGPVAVWYEDRHFHLVVLEGQAAFMGAFGDEPDGSLHTYQAYTIHEPLRMGQNLADTLRGLVKKGNGSLAVEMQHTTGLLYQVLAETGAALVNSDGWLNPLRMVKTAEELVKLRRNFALTDVGHAAAREVVAVGQREIDIWTAVHGAIERSLGQPVAMGNDCVVASRTDNIGAAPRDLPLQAHDSLTLDIGTGYQGYWSDSCSVYFVDEPTPKQKAVHQVVKDALEYAISLVKPGAVAREIDQKVRAFIEKAGYPIYPHHTGHGVGVTAHEAPRIVPYNDEVLEAGMVIMLEPGIYLPGEISIRLEDGMLVTADGAEVLTTHDKSGRKVL